MRGVEVFTPSGRQFESLGGGVGADAGDVQISMDVSRKRSVTLAGGVATFRNCALDWTVTYEEYLYCTEGTLKIILDDTSHVLKPGDAIWLPAGTHLIYESENAVAVFMIYPANWRERMGRTD